MSDDVGHQILAGLGEIKAEVAAQGVHLATLATRVGQQNGRVSKLEEELARLRLREAAAQGYEAGRAAQREEYVGRLRRIGRVLSRPDVRMAIGFVGLGALQLAAVLR